MTAGLRKDRYGVHVGRTRRRWIGALAGCAAMLAATTWRAEGASVTYTSESDFMMGLYTSTNSVEPPVGHVKLNDSIVTPFNHIWVAASGRGTAIRINTDTNPALIGNGDTFLTTAEASGTAVFGEYFTAPNGMGRDPSRTTVDANGDVWVGNRAEAGGGMGSVVKISASPMGITSDGVFGSAANGGVAGTYNALPWTNAGGADSAGGTSTSSDSAHLLYVRTAGTNVRTIAVNENNDVWVGGYGDKEHQLHDGDTGAPLSGVLNFGGDSGYGGLIDGNGVLWSAGWSFSSLSRYDPATGIETNPAVGGGSYGLAVDTDGNIWNTHLGTTVTKLTPAGGIIFTTNYGGESGGRGVAVTPADNNVWIANSFGSTVTRLNSAGVVQATVAVGSTPTGVAVDSNGKVWVTNFGSNTVSRIDPTTNLVDLTVDLGPGATPYNYSDMTGSVLFGTTINSGTWREVYDSGDVMTDWEEIYWNTEAEADIPLGTNLVLEARVSDDQLTWTSYLPYDSGDFIGLTGRYLEMRATFSRGVGISATPVLSDVSVNFSVIPEPATLAVLTLGGVVALGRRRRRKATS